MADPQIHEKYMRHTLGEVLKKLRQCTFTLKCIGGIYEAVITGDGYTIAVEGETVEIAENRCIDAAMRHLNEDSQR
jgi:hypothetical protein